MLKIPLTGPEVVERHFLEVRAKLLEIAATLDRIDRAGKGKPLFDPRLSQIRTALELLAGPSEVPDRAARIQMLFSRPYDTAWTADFAPLQRQSQP